MKVLLGDAGLKCLDVEGIAWSPTRGLHLSDDVRLNYLIRRSRAESRTFNRFSFDATAPRLLLTRH